MFVCAAHAIRDIGAESSDLISCYFVEYVGDEIAHC